jgi:phosphatidate cytidylyltransferase
MDTPLFINPLENQMIAPVATLLLIAFGGAACALEALQLRSSLLIKKHTAPSGATPVRVLWQRYRTWAIIAPLFAGAALSGPLAVALLCAFLCWQGGREYAMLTALSTLHRAVLIMGGWLTLAAALVFGSGALLAAPMLAFFAWSLLALQPIAGEAGVERRFAACMASMWGYLYIGWLPAYLVALSAGRAPGLVLLVGLGVALSDVGAFCAGKAIGGAKLAPRLSPNKTWGGVLGNLLGAALAVLLTGFALPGFTWWQGALFIAPIALGSVWGDLLESLLKRQSGVKDAGALLPGFGGLLDRIDSLLLVVPLIYYLSRLLIG